jgi:hypothetical protein
LYGCPILPHRWLRIARFPVFLLARCVKQVELERHEQQVQRELELELVVAALPHDRPVVVGRRRGDLREVREPGRGFWW